MTTILSKKVSAALVGLHGLRDSFVSCLLPTLTSTNLLSTISCLHRTLDPLDIEGLETLWQKSRPNRSLGEGEANPNLEEWSSFVHEFLLNQARHQDSTTPRADKLRYYLLSALMSGTFKDCSIIIRFPPSPQTEPTATVIDLDTKNITKLNQWAEADRHIIEDWRHGERSSSERICVDSRAPCPEIGGIPS
jgi:inositol-pentakisphosphate 2-kinase